MVILLKHLYLEQGNASCGKVNELAARKRPHRSGQSAGVEVWNWCTGVIQRLEQIAAYHLQAVLTELRRIFGDGVNQAADLVSGATSIPSRNLTPLMTFGN